MNKKAISPLLATILIVGFTLILLIVVIDWGFEFVENSQWYLNRECSKNPENCVCEEFVSNIPIHVLETSLKSYKRDHPLSNCSYDSEERVSAYECSSDCKKYRLKTEEEKYCDSNPNDESKCECLEYENKVSITGLQYGGNIALNNSIYEYNTNYILSECSKEALINLKKDYDNINISRKECFEEHKYVTLIDDDYNLDYDCFCVFYLSSINKECIKAKVKE